MLCLVRYDKRYQLFADVRLGSMLRHGAELSAAQVAWNNSTSFHHTAYSTTAVPLSCCTTQRIV
jgi:hypothetical protein